MLLEFWQLLSCTAGSESVTETLITAPSRSVVVSGPEEPRYDGPGVGDGPVLFGHGSFHQLPRLTLSVPPRSSEAIVPARPHGRQASVGDGF